MQFRALIAAGWLGASVSSTAFAGFSISWTSSDVGNTTEYYLSAINDGITTGTKLLSYDMHFAALDTRVFFRTIDVEGDGMPDGVDLPNVVDDPSKSFLRIGNPYSTTVFYTQPNLGNVEAWADGLSNFNVASRNIMQPPVATGAGTIFARLIVDQGAPVHVYGQMGGEVGPAIDVSATLVVPEPSLTAFALLATPLVLRRR